MASVCASSAVDANVRINLVDVALGDGSGRALTLAGTASYAVVSNFVSHNYIILKSRKFKGYI